MAMGDKLRFSLVLSIIAAVCVAGLCGVYHAVAERREQARRQKILEAVTYACGPLGCVKLVVGDPVSFSYQGRRLKYYPVYDEPEAGKKELKAYASLGEGKGYGGRVTVMVGWRPDLSEMVGIKVVEQTETPGLGSRVNEVRSEMTLWKAMAGQKEEPKTPWFQQQFGDTVKTLADMESEKFDGISGATITSNAVKAAIRDSHDRLKAALGRK